MKEETEEEEKEEIPQIQKEHLVSGEEERGGKGKGEGENEWERDDIVD